MFLSEDIQKLTDLGLTPEQLIGVMAVTESVTKRNAKRDNVTQRDMSQISNAALRQRRHRFNKKVKEIQESNVTPSVTKSVTPLRDTKSTDCLTTSLTSDPVTVKKVRKARQTLSAAYTENFDQFWQDYPSNNGTKSTAFEKYQQQLDQGISHEIISSGARAYSAYAIAEGTERRYVKHAATWLHQRGWETDYAQALPWNGARPMAAGRAERPGKSELARRAIDRAFSEMEDDGLFGQQGPHEP